MSAEHERLKEILAEAAALATPEGRRAYLEIDTSNEAFLRADDPACILTPATRCRTQIEHQEAVFDDPIFLLYIGQLEDRSRTIALFTRLQHIGILMMFL